MRDPVADQRRAHAEDGVRLQVRIALTEDVGNERLVTLGEDHEVQMCRTPSMTAECLQHIADGSVVRNRIGLRNDRPELYRTIRLAAQNGSTAGASEFIPMHVVQAVSVAKAELDSRPADRCGSW